MTCKTIGENATPIMTERNTDNDNDNGINNDNDNLCR